jgi:putative transposase
MQTVGELSSARRDLALRRFRLLEPHLEHGRPLRVIAAEAGIPFRAVQRWAAQYRKFGLVALARKMRGDNGVRRAVSANLKAAIEGLARERPPLPITPMYRQNHGLQLQRVRALRATGLSIAWIVTCRKVLRSLTEATRPYSESFDLVHRREASKPNAIWQADHAQLDILLLR